MSETTYIFNANFNRIDMYSWIDQKRLPDGSYALVGMGRCAEYDHKTGVLVSDKIEPTGARGWAPHNAFGERRTLLQWLRGKFGDA